MIPQGLHQQDMEISPTKNRDRKRRQQQQHGETTCLRELWISAKKGLGGSLFTVTYREKHELQSPPTWFGDRSTSVVDIQDHMHWVCLFVKKTCSEILRKDFLREIVEKNRVDSSKRICSHTFFGFVALQSEYGAPGVSVSSQGPVPSHHPLGISTKTKWRAGNHHFFSIYPIQ